MMTRTKPVRTHAPPAAELQGRRVLMVLGDLQLGGAEKQAVLLARHLARHEGAIVQVWGFDGPGRAADLLSEAGIPWRVVGNPLAGPPWKKLWALGRFALRLRAARPDVILSYTMPPNIACGLTWRWSGASACIWNQRDAGIHRFRRPLERLAVRGASAHFANGRAGAEFLRNVMAIPASRLHVISNGVDLPPPCRSRKAWRNKLQTGNRDFVACMPANISRAKDHATLLHAWRRVVDQWSGAGSPVLWLAGRAGDSFIAIHDLAQRLGLGSAVRFPGFTDDVAGLLAASDLVVYSSRSEGSPNAVLEGMAAGRAVVASDIVAHRELLGSRETLTTPGDARELAQRILEMAANAERRRSHARRNHRRARKFTAQQMCRASCRRLALLLNQARRS